MVRAEGWNVGMLECADEPAPEMLSPPSNIIPTFQPSNVATVIARSPICTPCYEKSPSPQPASQRRLFATILRRATLVPVHRDPEGGAAQRRAASQFPR